jgi:hypothetical protein
LRGRLWQAEGHFRAAQALFKRAIARSREQGARFLELNAARYLVRRRRDRRQRLGATKAALDRRLVSSYPRCPRPRRVPSSAGINLSPISPESRGGGAGSQTQATAQRRLSSLRGVEISGRLCHYRKSSKYVFYNKIWCFYGLVKFRCRLPQTHQFPPCSPRATIVVQLVDLYGVMPDLSGRFGGQIAFFPALRETAGLACRAGAPDRRVNRPSGGPRRGTRRS